MKHNTIESLGIGGKEVVPASGGGNFLKQANTVINNFRDLIKMVQSLQGTQARPQSPPPPPAEPLPIGRATPKAEAKPPPPPPPPSPEDIARAVIAVALDMAVKSGLGDKAVGDILDLARPFTINQLREYLK